MSKKLNLNVSFGKKTHIFECDKNEVEQDLADYFNLKPEEIDFYRVYKGTKTKIKLSDIKDLMSIEIVKKTETPSPSVPKFASDYEIGESSKQQTILENLVSKLKNNATLNGMERKYLMQMIEGDGHNGDVRLNRKRKSESLDKTRQKPLVSHKKVQVNAVEFKDSCCQTDVVKDDVLRPPETELDVLQKMKIIAKDKLNQKETEKLMSDTYDDRRNYIILKMPPIIAVKEKYPLLFTVKEVKNELDRSFYFGKSEDFLKNIAAYAPIILAHDPQNYISRRALRYMEKAGTEKQKKYAEQVGALLLLPEIFREKLSFLKLADNQCSPGIYPHISSETTELKEMFIDACRFKIIVENTLLCTVDTYPEAILCMVAAFYIFNISYNPDYFNTCVAFEKLFLTANETENMDRYTEQMIKFFTLKLGL